jgi:hypothetical protein
MLSRINLIRQYIYQVNAMTFPPLVRRLLFGGIIVLSFVLIYVLNVLHPLFGDDWLYSVTNTGRRLSSFGDILSEQYRHYFTWGGRSIVHVIAQSLLLAGTGSGDLLNSAAYVAFVLVIYRIANGNRPLNLSLLIGVNLLVWFFQRAFASSVLWIIGSANYLWGTLIVILFLTPYFQMIFNAGKSSGGWLKCTWIFVCGVIAGWTNENTSIALIFILAALLFYARCRDSRFSLWGIAGLTGAVLGCILMIAAPGNYARSEYFKVYEGKETGIYSVDAVVDGLSRAFWGFYNNTFALTFIFFLLVALFAFFGEKEQKRRVCFVAGLLFTAALLATLSMAAAPVFPDRASFGLNTFIIIAIGMLYARMDASAKTVKWLGRIAILYALPLFLIDYQGGYRELSFASRITQERDAIVEEGKKAGQTDFVFNGAKIEPHTRFLHYWDLSDDPCEPPNTWFIRYYGIHSAKRVDK